VDPAAIKAQEVELDKALTMTEDVDNMLEGTQDPEEEAEIHSMLDDLGQKALVVSEVLEELKARQKEYIVAKRAAEAEAEVKNAALVEAYKAAVAQAAQDAQAAQAAAEAAAEAQTPLTMEPPPPSPAPVMTLEFVAPQTPTLPTKYEIVVDPTASEHLQELQTIYNEYVKVFNTEPAHRAEAEGALAGAMQHIEEQKAHEAQEAASAAASFQPFGGGLAAPSAATGQEFTALLHPSEIGFGMQLDVIYHDGLDHVGVSGLAPGGPGDAGGLADGDVVRAMAGVQFPTDGIGLHVSTQVYRCWSFSWDHF
jgi:hypothetical protein